MNRTVNMTLEWYWDDRNPKERLAITFKNLNPDEVEAKLALMERKYGPRGVRASKHVRKMLGQGVLPHSAGHRELCEETFRIWEANGHNKGQVAKIMGCSVSAVVQRLSKLSQMKRRDSMSALDAS